MDSLTLQWILRSAEKRYTHSFTWLGRPVIQFPQDLMGIQEIVWRTRPEAIVETGVAHGGSLIYWASLLELLKGDGRVWGVDVEIRVHNREAIENHPLSGRIELLEGSSVNDLVFSRVQGSCQNRRTMVILDSNHTHDHVLRELQLYSTLVQHGSYLIVMDTIIEDMPEGWFTDRPWDKGNNPKTAVWEFLENNDRFEIDRDIETKLAITAAPDGWLRCIRD